MCNVLSLVIICVHTYTTCARKNLLTCIPPPLRERIQLYEKQYPVKSVHVQLYGNTCEIIKHRV